MTDTGAAPTDAAAEAVPPIALPEWLAVGTDLPTREERRAEGKRRRKDVPFEVLGTWAPPADRADPVDLLQGQATTRLPELVPIRYGRMLASPFAYYRGTPIVMAADLAASPTSGLTVQACGDAHVGNFGLFATPERNLIFDVNDFDETLPGPWEWDVKRLVASLVIAGRQQGLDEAGCAEVAHAASLSYAHHMAEYAEMSYLDVWYSRVDANDAGVLLEEGPMREEADKRIKAATARATARTNATALPKLTQVVDGRRRIIDDPPLITHALEGREHDLLVAYETYRVTLPDDRRVLLDRYHAVDVVLKVVGVGSVGTRCFVVLLLGADGADPLFLQVKEAERSVLEPHVAASEYAHQGQRVVQGQRLMQAASDLFLGWTEGPAGHHFYVRQLRDMKGSLRIDRMGITELRFTGEVCAWTLARAHARSGDAPAIAGYVGKGEAFASALGRFGVAYADQIEADHEAFRQAANKARIFAVPGL